MEVLYMRPLHNLENESTVWLLSVFFIVYLYCVLLVSAWICAKMLFFWIRGYFLIRCITSHPQWETNFWLDVHRSTTFTVERSSDRAAAVLWQMIDRVSSPPPSLQWIGRGPEDEVSQGIPVSLEKLRHSAHAHRQTQQKTSHPALFTLDTHFLLL